MRYAVYYTPPPGSELAEFGASWLGWDSAAGAFRQHPVKAGLDMTRITATPRKYGFHGTIKAPFRLAEGMTVAGLSTALERFCAGHTPVVLEGLTLGRLGRFLALVPTGDTTALAALAARAVQDLDAFRTPLDEADLAKYRERQLTDAQRQHLARWGYPFVLDEFRFHLTLTAKLDRETASSAYHAIDAALADLKLAPFKVSDLTLSGEDEAGFFHDITRCSLGSKRLPQGHQV